MSDYSQGLCQDGAAILRDGERLTIEEILEGLRERDQLAAQVERLRIALSWYELQSRLCRKLTGEGDEARLNLDRDAGAQARLVLEETPAQALAEIRAVAIERMCNQWQSEANDLPAQHEQPSKGCSTYNWQSHYSRIGLAYASRLRTTNKSGGGNEH